MTQLVRWDPFGRDFGPLANFGALTNRLDRVLSSWERPEQGFFDNWYPAVDIHDEGDHIVLRAELPGMKKEDIDIHVENNVLTLAGQRQPDVDDSRMYRSERLYGRFSRSFTLPTIVDASHISAIYRDGILTVELPKAEEARPRQIQVNVA